MKNKRCKKENNCNNINNKIRNLLFHSAESSQGLWINVGIINLVVWGKKNERKKLKESKRKGQKKLGR